MAPIHKCLFLVVELLISNKMVVQTSCQTANANGEANCDYNPILMRRDAELTFRESKRLPTKKRFLRESTAEQAKTMAFCM